MSGTLYQVDLDQRMLIRYPATIDADPEIALWLRRDRIPVPLLRLVVCEVGLPAVFAIDLGVEGVPFTLRTTATVCWIERDGETD